jgi:F-type H+-transporting ATPase subunit delta
MHSEQHNSPTALAYAQALLDLAQEAKTADSIGQELQAIGQLINENPDFAQLLADPAIGHEERGKLIHRLFDGRASQLMLNFLGLTNQKGRLGLLRSISLAYDELLDQEQGIIEVDVTVAERMGDDQLENVRRKVSDALKREAVVHQYLDPAIIGGLVLRVRDQLIDGSVRAQIAAMRQNLLDARPV